MKKLLFFFLLPLYVTAQKLPDFGISRVRLVETDKTILAEIYPVKKSITPQNDKSYHWYGSNMIHATQGGYSGKLLNGNYKEYYLNKNLKEEGSFNQGLKEGDWKGWNANGILLREHAWKKGALTGEFSIYDDEGILKQRGSYRHNLLQGKVMNYIGRDSVTVVYYNHGMITEKPKSFWSRLNLFKTKH